MNKQISEKDYQNAFQTECERGCRSCAVSRRHIHDILNPALPNPETNKGISL